MKRGGIRTLAMRRIVTRSQVGFFLKSSSIYIIASFRISIAAVVLLRFCINHLEKKGEIMQDFRNGSVG